MFSISHSNFSTSFEYVYLEFLRVLLLSTVYTLGPISAASLVIALLQALFQIQDSVSPQFVKLLCFYLIIYFWGGDLVALWQDLNLVFAEVSR